MPVMNRISFLYIISILFFVTSCKTQPKVSELNYMQNAEQQATNAAAENSISTIQKGDQLVILVTAKNMDVVKPFNQNYSSGQATQYSQPSGNSPSQGQTQVSGPTYIVDSEGNIDFPVLGTINTTGKTAVELKDEIRRRLTAYVIDPGVSLRITNYKITILGEVNQPGQYNVPDGQATLLNVLGLAGDLTMYGKRNDVLLIRNEDGNISRHRVDLMDANFINSPYYQLKQGDVIYVSANETKEKTARQDPNTNLYLAIAGTVIGLAGIFITIFKN